jgi:hypothetical protein
MEASAENTGSPPKSCRRPDHPVAPGATGRHLHLATTQSPPHTSPSPPTSPCHRPRRRRHLHYSCRHRPRRRRPRHPTLTTSASTTTAIPAAPRSPPPSPRRRRPRRRRRAERPALEGRYHVRSRQPSQQPVVQQPGSMQYTHRPHQRRQRRAASAAAARPSGCQARLRPRQWSGAPHFQLERCYLGVSAPWGSRCAERRPRARSEQPVLFRCSDVESAAPREVNHARHQAHEASRALLL